MSGLIKEIKEVEEAKDETVKLFYVCGGGGKTGV